MGFAAQQEGFPPMGFADQQAQAQAHAFPANGGFADAVAFPCPPAPPAPPAADPNASYAAYSYAAGGMPVQGAPPFPGWEHSGVAGGAELGFPAAGGSIPAYGDAATSYGTPVAQYGQYGMQAAPFPVASSGIGLAPQKPLVIIPLCRKGDRAGIERQLQAGATVDETDMEGNTPLHVAVEAPKNEIATVQCLLENGSDANALNYIGATPLHYVCLRKSNYRGVANILLENGAQINRQTVAGKSSLHFACENQLTELVEVLCLFGADTNLADVEGNTPVHLTVLKEGGRDTMKRQILEHLATYAACCTYANSEGLTALHLACQSGYIRCVQYLVDRGADVSAVTLRGQNGLHLACLHGHAQVVQLLITLYPAALDLGDSEGNTALHCCSEKGSLDCALILLKLDANTNLRNVHKKTAFDMAKIRGTDLNNTHNPELVQVLKDAKKGGGCRQS